MAARINAERAPGGALVGWKDLIQTPAELAEPPPPKSVRRAPRPLVRRSVKGESGDRG